MSFENKQHTKTETYGFSSNFSAVFWKGSGWAVRKPEFSIKM